MEYINIFLKIIVGIILVIGWQVDINQVGFYRFLFTWILALIVIEILPLFLDK